MLLCFLIKTLSDAIDRQTYTNDYLEVNHSIYKTNTLYDEVAKPLIVQTQRRTGADLVILSSGIFTDILPQGQLTIEDISNSVKVDKIVLRQIQIKGFDLKAMLQQLVYQSYCQQQLIIPELHGIFLGVNESNCFIYQAERCSWTVSESHLCKRWSPIKRDDILYVLVEDGYYRQILELQDNETMYRYNDMGPLAPLNVSLLIYNFVVKFGDKVFQNEYTMKIENKSELHGFYITLTILLFIGIISKIYLAVNKNGSGDPVVSNQSQNQSSIGQDV